jgi:cephalosporin hydroxylase
VEKHTNELASQRSRGASKILLDADFQSLSAKWKFSSRVFNYSYLFDWLGRPIIQYPQDIVALQELVWAVRPSVIVETGIAHGGSLVLSASLLALLDVAESVESGRPFDPRHSSRRVIGVDIDIRSHNRVAIEEHPMSAWITMIEGSSIDPVVVREVHSLVSEDDVVMVLLDSNHTHDHVLAELEAYSSLVSPGSYCIVYDTVIEDMPAGSFPDRPWEKGDNPRTAVDAFLARNPNFVSDDAIPGKLQITVAPGGYLRRAGQ